MINSFKLFMAGQTLASLAVIGLGIYALGLSVAGLLSAVEYRLVSGSIFSGANNADPLFEAGTSLGFYGSLFFALNFVLSTRWRWVERVFGGLERLYALHAMSGKMALTFVLLHTGILILQAIPEGPVVAKYLIPGVDLSYTFGLIGTFGLLGLVTLTLWVKLPYESWLATHKLMIVPFIGGILHELLPVRWTRS